MTENGRLAIGEGQSYHLYDLESENVRTLPRLFEPHPLELASLDQSGRYLALADKDGRVCVWDLEPDPVSWTGSAMKAVEDWTGTTMRDFKLVPLE